MKEDAAPGVASTGRAHGGLWVGCRVPDSTWACTFLHPQPTARGKGGEFLVSGSCDFLKQVKTWGRGAGA